MAESQPGFLQELKRRKVYRVAIAYIVAAWVALQFLDLVLENVNAPDWVMQMIMAVLAIGFPVALVLAWAFDITPDIYR
jgi:adenylate cyclase